MKFQKTFFCALVCAALVQPSRMARADSTGDGLSVLNIAAKNNQNFVFNYGPPQNPALNLLGVQASKATISSSPQTFLMSLPGLINGSANQNLGLDFTPFWTLRDDAPFSDIYNAPADYAHILYDSQFEIAETAGTASTNPSKIQPSGIAAGVYTSLLPYSDPFISDYNSPQKGQTYDESCLDGYHLAGETPGIPISFDGNLHTAYNTLGAAVHNLSGNIKYKQVLTNVLGVLNGTNGLIYYSENPENPKLTHPFLSISPLPQQLAKEISEILNAPTNRNQDFTTIIAELQALQTSLSSQVAGYVTTCSQAAAIIAGAAPDVRIGFGYLESGTPGALSHFRAGGETEWLAGRYPIFANIAQIASDPSQIAGTDGKPSQLRYTMIGGSIQAQQASTLTTGNAKTPIINANVYSGWLGIESDASYYRFALQGGYTDTFADLPKYKNFASHGFRWLATAAFQLPDQFNPVVALFDSKAQVWLNGSYGTANGSSTNLNDKTFLLSFTISPPTSVQPFSSPSN